MLGYSSLIIVLGVGMKPTFETVEGWRKNLVFTMKEENSNNTLNFLHIKTVRIDKKMDSNNGVKLNSLFLLVTSIFLHL